MSAATQYTPEQFAVFRAAQANDWPTAAKLANELAARHPYQADEKRPPFAPLLPEQIFAPLPPIVSVLPELDMCVGAPVLVAGYGFSMKTLSLQDLALAKAMGMPVWSRFDGAQRLRVIHFDGEQGTRLTSERYQRLARGLGIDWRDLGDRLQVVVMPETKLDHPDALDVYTRALDGFDLAIFDSLRALAPTLDENSSDIRRVLDLLGAASEKTGVVPVVIHHARKPQQHQSGGAKMAVRGSGAIFDACGSVLVFSAEKDKPVLVQHEKARTSGQPHDDFAIVAEDVERDGDPRWGLRVVVKDIEPNTAKRSNKFEELKNSVVEAVRAEPGLSKNRIAAKTGKSKPTVLEAINELEERGRIVLVGNGYRVR